MTFEEENRQADDASLGDSPNTTTRNSNSPVEGQPRSPPSHDEARREELRLATADLHKTFEPTAERQDGLSAWSMSSDKQLASPSLGKDRLFPIRNFVGMDTSQTPYTNPTQSTRDAQEYFPPEGTNNSDIRRSLDRQSDRRTSTSTTQDDERHAGAEKYSGGDRMRLFSDATSEKLSQNTGSIENEASSTTNSNPNSHTNSIANYNPNDQDSVTGLITARFKHIVTENGHAVITGRDGETLQRCEDEPIHIPGAVQGFGLLIALEEQDDSRFVVRVVSENSHRIIGYRPRDLFKLNSFTDILSEEQVENLLDHVDFIQDDEADPSVNGPEVFIITIRHPTLKRNRKLWCAMHINPANAGLIICEFELDDDKTYPPVPSDEDSSPAVPEDTLNSAPSAEEYAESTLPSSKPLRVLRSARNRRGEAAAMEVFNIMSQVQEQLACAPNLDKFLKILVGVVKELTGFHRVMIYQFDAASNGRVVTELVDPRATKDLYKGLNFPASDIPKQARDLYKVNKVRLLYDRDLETARLVCRTVQDLETPLDLSFSYLRAMSPIHIKYLANMAVRSSMSISINAFGDLWGLIACHTYGPKGMRISFPIRKMCRLVGDTATRNIERLSYASRLQARKLINTVPTQTNPSGYIIASSDDLLSLFDADFGLLSIRGETKVLGKVEQTQEALAMLEYLRMRKITSVATSQDIKIDFPDLRYAPGFEVIAGLLLVPLSVGGGDFIVFFRKAQVKEVKWAGNPYEKFVKEGTEGYLEPRKSFKTWSEKVIGKCREWTEEQVETAAVLCLVYGKFIQVWREKEMAMQNSQLTRLLLANSAHEVRTPLNAVINYLEIALEGNLDQETRENITKSHSASKSLIYVINDLLDLTKTEEGQDLIKDEAFDLPGTIREAVEAFRGDANRKGLEYQIIEHPGFPQHVLGDQRRIRQAVANIITNSIQNTLSGSIHVEMWLHSIVDNRAAIEIVIQDSGIGMSNEKLDELFRELEQVTEDGGGIVLDDPGTTNQNLPKKNDRRTLGLGLAMVARIIRNAEGQLRVKSEEGKGSRFVMQLTFSLPDEEDVRSPPPDPTMTSNHSASKSINSVLATPPVAAEGEVTLVPKGTGAKRDSVARKRSHEEVSSLRSFRSGSSNKSDRSAKSNRSNMSDVDRLIDAISGPLLVGEVESEERSLQRRNSKESAQTRRSVAGVGIQGPFSSHGRPSTASRSRSYGAPEHLRSPVDGPPGSEFITDNKTMMSAIRMPDEFSESTSDHEQADVAYVVSPDVLESSGRSALHAAPLDAAHLNTLVAEDDPVNSRIITKRLERSGHRVYHTINGEECARAYGEKPAFFDVVLMDMQMPIVDGLTSTKMIRSFEKSHAGQKLSARAAVNGRLPIFAVSASLVERNRQMYIDAGFDGWILKPIDFKRLNVLFSGIVDENARNECLYQPGEWERGGWFHKRQPSVWAANTHPSNETPVQNPPTKDAPQPDVYSLDHNPSA